MTAARNVRPGITWFVTRRATRRHYLFSPDKEGLVEQLYWYVTAVYAAQLGISLHAVQVLSNHLHEVLTDTRGELPEFFEKRNAALARALKVLRGWPGEVLDKAPASWVEVCSAEAVVQQIAYTIVNCVAAGLVRTPRRWPGVKVLADEVGRRVVKVKRPDFYFRADNPLWPDEVTVPIEMPALLRNEYGSDDECRQAIEAEVDELVRHAHARVKAQGCGYAGAKRVLKTPHTARANSYEEFGRHNPTIATGGNREAGRRAYAEQRRFRADYRAAWQTWRDDGDRGAMFPFGTWKMRRFHQACCRPPPPS